MRTHNICFYGEISKIIPYISPNTLLVCSTAWLLVLYPVLDAVLPVCVPRGILTMAPCHEVMVLFVLRKLIPQTRMRNHPVGLDV